MMHDQIPLWLCLLVTAIASAVAASLGEAYGRRQERRLCDLEARLAVLRAEQAADDARRRAAGEENGPTAIAPRAPLRRGVS